MITFPFLGIGGLTAIAVLVVGYTVFAVLLRLMDAAASGALSVVPVIVSGIRDWSRDDADDRDRSDDTVTEAAVPWEDLPPGSRIEDQVGAE
jgi:hypothetical protein